MDKAMIEKLSDQYKNKKMIFECHQMLNVWDKSDDELRKMARAYRVAEAEMMQAKADLDAAQRDQ